MSERLRWAYVPASATGMICVDCDSDVVKHTRGYTCRGCGKEDTQIRPYSEQDPQVLQFLNYMCAPTMGYGGQNPIANWIKEEANGAMVRDALARTVMWARDLLQQMKAVEND